MRTCYSRSWRVDADFWYRATLERLPRICLHEKKIARAIMLGIFASVIVTAIPSGGKPAGQGFLGTWSADQLLLQHRNPYDSAAVLASESTQGFEGVRPIAISKPPFTLLLAVPFAFMSAKVGLMFWMVAALACLSACLHAFRVVWRYRILAYCFAPVFACLAGGEFAPFVLLGFSLFVLFRRTRPAIAGVSLLFLSVEPHLAVVLAPVLLLDCLYRRNWRLVAGAGLAFAAAFTAAPRLAPNIWSRYAAMQWGGFRDAASLLSHPSGWVQWLPAMVATVWALCLYWSKRRAWNWVADSVPLLFVTALVVPFASVADQVLLLPAVLVSVASANRARYAATSFVAINAAALTLIVTQENLGPDAALGTSMAWFAWYLYSSRGRAEARLRNYGVSMAEA